MTSTRPNSKTAYVILALLLAVTAVFYLSDIDENHRWWGDFSLYMAHAKNIVSQQPYGETDFVINPYAPRYSPPAYPPVYPAMLAPVYKAFGLNLYAPKVLNLFIFLGCLVIFYAFYTHRLTSDTTRLIAVTLVAFNPWFWGMKNLIMSEIPFILFLLSALFVIDRLAYTPRQKNNYWPLAVLLGILLYLSYGTRTLGLILLPTLITYDVVKNRSLRAGPILAILIFLVLHQLQDSFIAAGIDQSYTNAVVTGPESVNDPQAPAGTSGLSGLIHELPVNIVRNLEIYATVLLNLWNSNASLALRVVTTVITGLLALAGFIQALRKHPSAMELFFVFYIGALLIVPFSQGARYLLPVLPAYILYCCMGAEKLTARISVSTPGRPYIPVLLLLLCGVSYAGYYLATYGKESYFGVTDTESVELFDYIRNNTPANSHIKFHRPRILALYTGRKSSLYNLETRSPSRIWNDFKPAGVSHLLIYSGDDEWAHRTENDAFIESSPAELDKVFENRYFRLYKITYSGA